MTPQEIVDVFIKTSEALRQAAIYMGMSEASVHTSNDIRRMLRAKSSDLLALELNEELAKMRGEIGVNNELIVATEKKIHAIRLAAHALIPCVY